MTRHQGFVHVWGKPLIYAIDNSIISSKIKMETYTTYSYSRNYPQVKFKVRKDEMGLMSYFKNSVSKTEGGLPNMTEQTGLWET